MTTPPTSSLASSPSRTSTSGSTTGSPLTTPVPCNSPRSKSFPGWTENVYDLFTRKAEATFSAHNSTNNPLDPVPFFALKAFNTLQYLQTYSQANDPLTAQSDLLELYSYIKNNLNPALAQVVLTDAIDSEKNNYSAKLARTAALFAEALSENSILPAARIKFLQNSQLPENIEHIESCHRLKLTVCLICCLLLCISPCVAIISYLAAQTA